MHLSTQAAVAVRPRPSPSGRRPRSTTSAEASRRTRTAYRCGIRADARLHERSGVLGRELARPEPLAGGAGVGDPVDPEGAPVLAVAVVGDEVPAAAERDQPVRLDPALRSASPSRAV